MNFLPGVNTSRLSTAQKLSILAVDRSQSNLADTIPIMLYGKTTPLLTPRCSLGTLFFAQGSSKARCHALPNAGLLTSADRCIGADQARAQSNLLKRSTPSLRAHDTCISKRRNPSLRRCLMSGASTLEHLSLSKKYGSHSLGPSLSETPMPGLNLDSSQYYAELYLSGFCFKRVRKLKHDTKPRRESQHQSAPISLSEVHTVLWI